MIGILIVTHKGLGDALIEATEFVMGRKLENVMALSINMNENADALRDKVLNGIKQVNKGEGVLILTDMFGGTPSNISYSLLEEGKVEVLSGVNLPIVIKALNAREKESIETLPQTLENYGKRSISLASALLHGNKKQDKEKPKAKSKVK